MDQPHVPAPKRRMNPWLKTTLWLLLASWLGWIVCSIVALNGSGVRPQAGSGGGTIAIQVLIIAITGETEIGWALTGTRIFGAAMVLILLGLGVWYLFLRKPRPDEARSTD